MKQAKVIAVDGNIGVGKTTFVADIAKALDMQVVGEEFEDNPYLEEFYRDQYSPGIAHKTEEWFIKNRLESYEKAVASRSPRATVVDRPPSSTLVFVTTLYEDGKLTEEEYEDLMTTYQDINSGVMSRVGQPDLYVYLDASPERCLQAIRTRGRPMEQDIPLEYLQHLGDVWRRMNSRFYTCPYVVVDWEAYGDG